MICPKCKKTIPDNTLKCPHCKTRTGILCKNCNTINPIQNLVCQNCGKELLKICKVCKSINLPDVKKCRKCGTTFEPKGLEHTLIYKSKLVSQKKAVEMLVTGIQDNKQIISLSGSRGIGKSEVLKTTIHKLRKEHCIWLFGKCTHLTQLTAGGVIQDIILNMFNLPNFCANTQNFKKDVIKFLQNEFKNMTNSELSALYNFLYPTKGSTCEELPANKKYFSELLLKMFDILAHKGNVVIIIDNFDFIDGFSYEFINNLLKLENIPIQLILMYHDEKPAGAYFYLDNNNSYLDIAIAPLNQIEMREFCKTLEDDFSYTNAKEKQEIIEKSKGNPAFIEQALSLCFDCQMYDKNFVLTSNFDRIIQERLKNLKEVNNIAYKTLVSASILGDKINIALLQEIFQFEPNNLKEIIEYLIKMRFIKQVNENICEFKNLLLWETILTYSKKDEDFISINNKIAEALTNFTMNSNAVLGVIAQNLKRTQFALKIWTKNTKYAAAIGDTNLYVILQKQCLALINELDECDTLKIRYNISERLGKVLSDYNPQEALGFLPDAIANAKSCSNTTKEIELLAYLSSCCMKLGNFYGCIECVDNVLGKLTSENKLEKALLKACKLEALINIGNCEEVINIIDNDIIPVLDTFFVKKQKSKISYEFIYETWLKTYLILAQALVIQGNDRCFEILAFIFELIEKNKIKDDLFISKCKITLAFANTIKGDISTSEGILQEVISSYQQILDNPTILSWNIAKIFNNFFRKQYTGLREDLFEIVTFANNCGNEYIKNILKALLGKVFKDNGQTKQALEIYNNQITYFAKEKMAIGALLTWYLIAEATLDTEGPHAAIDIAEQAIEVANNPKLNNYFFIILFKMIIAKANIIISDYETAKINIENAINLAKKFELQELLSRLYLLYGKYFQEIGLLKTPQQVEYLNCSKKMYENANKLIEYTKNNHIHKEYENAKKVLASFCQLNKINLY